MSPSGQAPQGGLGRLVAGTIALALVAPVAVVALPLAVLLAVTPQRTRAELVTTGIASGFSAWWLLAPGQLPDQMLRAAAVLTTAGFVVFTVRTGLPFMYRALVSLAGAMVGVSALLLTLGTSWGELRWWVASRSGLAARSLMGMLWSRVSITEAVDTASPALTQLEESLGTMIQLTADFLPALTALELLAGLGLATAIYHRVARQPRGQPLGRFRDFRFSEHLGWALVLPLIAILVPKLVAAKAAAANLLLLGAALYALRGAAVAVFALHALGTGGFFLRLFLMVILVLMLPFVVGGAILLGVLDGGLDLRRRWRNAAAR